MSGRERQNYMPFHFGGWRANASVVLNPRRLLVGRLDLFSELDAFSHAEVARMRAVIAREAHRLVYGLVPFKDDAVETLLRGVLSRAKFWTQKCCPLQQSDYPSSVPELCGTIHCPQ